MTGKKWLTLRRVGTPAAVRYRSDDEDSDRWRRFAFRPGDIVISTRSKSGTTWMQMICSLLVHGTSDLPAPLAQLSPWLDWLIEPIDDVVARLDAQTHRRVVKSHTPLDGLPLDDLATYIVVARHPLDAALSLYHQGANVDRHRMAELTGQPAPAVAATTGRPEVVDWLERWVATDANPAVRLDSLPGFLHHLTDAWGRRHDPNVRLVHYDDLLADLDHQMRLLADHLVIEVEAQTWSSLVAAARFDAMAARSDRLAPDPAGILLDRSAFFRRGVSGDGRRAADDATLADYQRRAERLAPPDLLRWLHRPLPT